MMKVWQPSKEEIQQAESWGIWTKEPSTFPWEYTEKERCFILEGEAEVKADNDGKVISFKEGDMVEFDKGVTCTWTIKRAIKKRFIFG